MWTYTTYYDFQFVFECPGGKLYSSFRISIASSDKEAQELKNAWKKSDCSNRSEFIKMAVNSYALENNYSEDVIFKKIKVV